jgi:hypothetical protein
VRQSGARLVPYIEWKFPREPVSITPLKYILVGPAPHGDKVVEVVRGMARGVTVELSQIAYVNW